MTAEQVVLFAGTAVRASQAAHKEDGHAYRDQHGDDAPICREPVNQMMHMQENLRN